MEISALQSLVWCKLQKLINQFQQKKTRPIIMHTTILCNSRGGVMDRQSYRDSINRDIGLHSSEKNTCSPFCTNANLKSS